MADIPSDHTITTTTTTTVQHLQTETVVVEPDWENTIAQLRAANEQLQRRKEDAERDSELFRDLYNKASSHASQVSRENEELLERVTIAEGQARDGVSMVKRMSEERVAKLQGELAQLRGLNAVLTAKDVKSNGDHLRRRAAEQVELQVENQRLRSELAELRIDYDRMEGLLEQLGEYEQLGGQDEELRERVGVCVAQTLQDELSATPTGPEINVEQVD